MVHFSTIIIHNNILFQSNNSFCRLMFVYTALRM